MTSIGLGFTRGPGLTSASPLWVVGAASGQTGNANVGTGVTWQAGATTGAEASDPTYASGVWSFDGSQYISIDETSNTPLPTMGTGDAWTFMVVFRIASASGATEQILSTKPASQTASSLGLAFNITSATGVLRAQIGDGTNGATSSTTGMEVPTNVWAVAFVYTDAVTSFRTRCNGVTSSATARPAGSQTPTFGTFIARLASNLNSASSLFTGDIKVASAWQRQLSAAEMTALELYNGAGT